VKVWHDKSVEWFDGKSPRYSNELTWLLGAVVKLPVTAAKSVCACAEKL